MRSLCFLFLIGFATLVGIFAYENSGTVVVNVFGEAREVSFPLLAVATYGLGMISGWTVVGMLQRSWRRVTQYDRV